jgi:chromate reductase, NAD(P)H dehydrogenase (quinone)
MIPSAGDGIVGRTPKHCCQFITERWSAVSRILPRVGYVVRRRQKLQEASARTYLGGMRILAISGSLRSTSSNTALLRAAQILAPPGVDIMLYPNLGTLPHFNPDLDGETPPQSVLEWRAEVGLADGLLISSPEYAHGVPGCLKNALDWLVASVEFPGKAVALLDTSSRATHARAQLTEILTTMSARLIPEASVTIALPFQTADGAAFANNREFSRTLSSALCTFAAACSAGARYP